MKFLLIQFIVIGLFWGCTRSNENQRTDVAPPRSPDESLSLIHLPDGFTVELAAAEPLVLDPVAFDWDERGRLWVVEMADYPMGMDNKGKSGGRIRVLDDLDGDGQYDKSTLFVEDLNFPNGILTWRDGIIVTAAPDVLFLRDTDGDGKADETRKLVSGLQEGNEQLRANGLRWGLDNWVYVAAGGHHSNFGTDTKLKSWLTDEEVLVGSRDFRFRPDTGELEAQSGPTQFGRNRDNWGQWFGTQNSRPLWHYVLPDHYLRRNPDVASGETLVLLTALNPPVYAASAPQKRFHSFTQSGNFTSACGGMIYRGGNLFPAEETHAFVCEPVSNLVQQMQLKDSGVTFTATRVPGEGEFDFFASEDRWCRPVMVREGPDGALWVADMYRYMIEHPYWLPQEGKDELLPNYRSGEDRGRIYRIGREGMASGRSVRFDNMDSVELVAMLNSSNGFLRDKAHQVLLWRADKAAVPLLRKLASDGKTPLARLHALCVLDGLDQLPSSMVVEALHDDSAGVRQNALRLAETRFDENVLKAAVRLVDDPNPKLRLQLAFSLGASADAHAGRALGRILVENADEPMIVAAVMSSVTPLNIRVLSEEFAQSNRKLDSSLISPLLATAFGLSDRETLAMLLTPVLTPSSGRFSPEQFEGFTVLLELLARRDGSLEKLRSANRTDRLAHLLDNSVTINDQARTTASNASLSSSERIAAAVLLGHNYSSREEAVLLLSKWLDSKESPEVQETAIRALATTGSSKVPSVLAQAWSGFSPSTRQTALNSWLSRESWAFDLIQRLDRSELSVSSLDAAGRTRLLKHDSERVRKIAERLLSSDSSPGRNQVVEEYGVALALQGDSKKGHEIYKQSCIVCHKSGNEGSEIGPNLISVMDWSPEKLLKAILDPSADIQPGYNTYTCSLKNGELVYGLLLSETASSMTFKLLDGSQKTVLRNQVASFESMDQSLMPEGLEAAITHQDMSDLIAFLRDSSRLFRR